VVRPLRRLPPAPVVEVGYDIETEGFSDRILCVCSVGSDGSRVVGRTLDEWIAGLARCGLLRRKRGEVRFWAHYGGSFDVLVILRHLLRSGWKIEGGRAGDTGSFWAVDLVRGRQRLELRDSARLFVDSLRALGRAFGLEKLDVDRGNLIAIPIEETITYCLRDCEIVLRAVTQLQGFIRREGGELADTIAACASRIVRVRAVPQGAWAWSAETDQAGAQGYYGGRVERFRQESAGGSVFDVNSMYPWAMTHRLPTEFIGAGQTECPDSVPFAVVDATVRVPRAAQIGPLPHRPTRGALKGRLCFPVGTWRGTWTRSELETAARCVPGLEWKTHAWWGWTGEPWLRELVEGWYERRRAAATQTERYMLKLLLNSVSGKLIERAEYETLTSIRRVADRAEADGLKIVLYPTEHGVWYGMRERKVGALRHAAAAAHVLAAARGRLLEAMTLFARVGRVDYCDTDSVMGVGVPDDVDASRLGAWKHELQYKGGQFLAPKLYALESDDGKLLVKCKGWPKTAKNEAGDEVVLPPRELWARILACTPVRAERTTLIKSQIREGRIKFSRYKIERTRRPGIDKRCFDKRGESRPWDVAELEGLKDGNAGND
jgi:hypothetical protein